MQRISVVIIGLDLKNKDKSEGGFYMSKTIQKNRIRYLEVRRMVYLLL